jgi:N-acetylmuramoyl-L-alanine amidase/FlgD Ig-like domain
MPGRLSPGLLRRRFRECLLVRRLPTALLSIALIPAAIVVPVLSPAAAHPHPVAPHLVSLAITGATSAPSRASIALDRVEGVSASPPVETGQQATATFSTFGASWDGASDNGSAAVEVRVRAAGSHAWSDWTELDPADGGPDPGTPDAIAAHGRVASEPVWAGPSDAVQTRVVAAHGAVVRIPAHLSVLLVDPGTSAADAGIGQTPAGSAQAATGMPQIYTRSQWGADESIRLHQCPGGPRYSSTIKVGFVHHTVSSNSYSAAEVPAMIRGFYAYHVNGNGWCDIGYNFLVDRFGRVWEGRFGGITKAVIGAHTGGFNVDSFGVAMIGDFSSLTPNSAIQNSIGSLMAWKLGTYYRDPLGKDTLVYEGGGYRFCGSKECPAGSVVSLSVISGHRDGDVGHTACPGNAGEAALPSIRTATVAAMGAGLVSPSISATSHRLGDGGVFTITAGAVTSQSWTLTATSAAGTVVRTIAGSVGKGGRITASWDGLTDGGQPAAVGSYALRLDSAGATGNAVPYTAAVTLHAPVELTGPTQAGYGLPVALTGSTYPGSVVTLMQAPPGSTAFAPVATVGTDPAGNFSWTYPGTTAEATYAQVGANVSPTITTAIGPSITGPRVAVPGSQVTLTGTAPPGTTVQVFLQAGAATPILAATLIAGVDGGWTTSFTADVTYSWYAVANGLQSPSGSTSTSAPPTLTGPDHVNLHASVTLSGSAPAGQPVQIWRRERGHTAYNLSATVIAGPAGTFSWGYQGNDDFRWYATTPGGKSAIGLTQVGVTVNGPAKVDRGLLVSLRGTALPSAGVEIWRAKAGTATYAEAGTVTARTDGRWSWPFTVSGASSWYAVSRGWRSAAGTTLVASPPLISGPSTAGFDATVHITGRATPGDTVTLWLHRRGSTGYRGAATAVAGADGRWSTTYLADEDDRWYATSITGRSKLGTTIIKPAAAAVPTATRGVKVALHGFAVPGQVVHVYFKSSHHWQLSRTVRANKVGHWGITFTLSTTVAWYVESRGVRSATGITRLR